MDRGAVAGEGAGGLGMVAVREEQAGGGVGADLAELGRGEAGIERHRDRPGPGGGEEGLGIAAARMGEHGEAAVQGRTGMCRAWFGARRAGRQGRAMPGRGGSGPDLWKGRPHS
ncbi:MAG TPA: hypothetical protein VFR34_03320 [Paracoccaceae bacterium]|nr:hypothetical protein [Paracoccaceae bacterium]